MAFGPETPTSPRFAAWRTALWIGLFLAAGLALRMAFSVDAAFDDETGRYMYTGNDPYYHDRTVHSILDTGEHLRFDPAINYPAGGYNPNPPLFDWTTAPVAVGFDALGAQDPVGLALNVMVAVWGALIVLPVYHIGRDLWGRRAGLWGAFFIAVSAPHIQRTIFGFADHDATTLFFIALAFSFMVKALQAVERREYVTDWRHVAAVRAGLRSAVSANRTAFLWSALAGTALTATAVTWKGYPYALAVMAIGIGVQLLNDHLRNRDSTAAFGLYLIPLAMVAVLPYLLFYRAFPTFLDTTVMPSLYVLLGVVVVGLVLVPTRQLPSILVFPVLIAAAVGGIVALKLFVPGVYTTISTGLGYFQQSKLYGTIAEAQRSELGYVAASFGFFSFILAFWGFGKLLKGTYRGDGAATLVASWSLVALFMAFAATRFILNAAPIFAILMGAATSGIVGKLGFAEVGRRFRARPGGVVGGAFGSLDGKSAIGASLVFLLLVVPNAWIGVDAAMPSEYEADHNLDRQYFGAFGISFEVRNDGWLPVMDELGDRDSCRSDPLAVCAPGDADYQPMEDRPAFIAWWDYGHWATGIALHPTVADPFQNHYNLAGRFLASESEREAVAWLTILLLNNDYAKNGGHFSPAVDAALRVANPALIQLGGMKGYDAQYEAYNRSVAPDGEQPFQIYEGVMGATGDRIHYVGVGLRMYPRSVREPGIFYAPAYLANKNPDDFLTTTYPAGSISLTQKSYHDDELNHTVTRLSKDILTDESTGKEYEIVGNRAYLVGKTPYQGYSESTGLQISEPQLQPTERFFNSLYARAYGGLATAQPAGDGMRHFRVIAQSSVPATNGLQLREVALLEYFAGATVSGTVRDDAGNPMSGAEVSFKDGFNGTHDRAITGADGRYSILAPFSDEGDLRFVVRAGGQEVFSDAGLQVSRAQAAGRMALEHDATVPRADVFGRAYRDLDGQAGYNATTDQALAGATVEVGGQTRTTDGQGLYTVTALQAGLHTLASRLADYQDGGQSVILKAGESKQVDLAMSPLESVVTFQFRDGDQGVANIPIRIEGEETATLNTNVTGEAQATLLPGHYEAVIQAAVTDPQSQLETRYDQRQAFDIAFGGAPRTIVIDAVHA